MGSRANRAMAAMRDGDFPTAVRLFNKLGKLAHADDRLAKAAGFAYLRVGDNSKALTALTAALRSNSEQADIHAAMGDIYVVQSDEDNALRHLRKAVELESRIPQLHYKLGLALIGFERWDKALESMGAARELDPNNLQARLGLARTLTELRDFEAAESELEYARTLAPDNYAIAFRTGKLREKQRQFDAAIRNYLEAEEQSQHAAPVCEALALAELAVGNTDGALAAFKRGLRRNPTNTTLLKLATGLRYQMGDSDAFSHFEDALRVGPALVPHANYISRLILAERLDDADRQLRRFETNFGRSPDWQGLAAELHEARGDYEKMLSVLGKAPSDDHALMIWKAKALLGCGDSLVAQALLLELLKIAPRDQLLIALLSTCYRLNDPAAYAELVDYEKLVIRREISPPPGYGSVASFNAALRETLEEFHVTRVNPLAQSVVGGTQTPGNLLRQPHPVIVALNQAFQDTLTRELAEGFYKKLADNHPVRVGRGHGIRLPAAWSIWVTEGGYHRSHVHSEGWYSSAYYVSLPSTLEGADVAEPAGALEFGRPGTATPQMLAADHVVPPIEGTLTLFPSYFWHGTLPYSGSEPRVTVAFDAVPTP